MTLDDIREQWERDMIVKCHIKKPGYVHLVVLEEVDPEGGDYPDKYHAHRYFSIGSTEHPMTGGWECSVDHQRIDLDGVFAWVNKMFEGEGI